MLLLFVATTVVGALLAPHPQGPQPSALGDFSVPTAQEGRAIPVVLGTCLIKGGNTVWWGDLVTKPVRSKGGILSFGATQIIGYKYFLGCQFMLCHGPVDFVDVQADAKSIPHTSSVVNNGNATENYTKLNLTGDNLFGGTSPGGGGGISGRVNFYRGLETQQPDDYLTAKQGRVSLTQSGLPYLFTGVGNGTISSISGGPGARDETITITCLLIDGNVLHSTFGKAKFSVIGSVSGAQENGTLNPEFSDACWADAAFSCPIISMTVNTGSTQFAPGDTFTIVTQHSHVAPAYRGLCQAVFQQTYMGTSNYLKPVAFAVRRCPDPFAQGAGVANLNGDANGALGIYDILTSTRYGLGIPPTAINATSFQNAASTLASEGLGISMMFDQQASGDQLLGEILRHIDGVLYTDQATGLWTITLARGGYDPTTLPTLTVDSVIGTPDYSRGSWEETTNQVQIKYTARVGNFEDAMITAYDPANIKVTGTVRPQAIDFRGISQQSTAGLVAIRVLKTLTYPLAKMKIVANRAAWNYRPGGLFRFTWVPLGITNMVFRITRIGYGELADGKITIDCVQDIFGINSVAFTSPPASGWVNPVGAPVAPAANRLVEVPWALAQDGIRALAVCVRADRTSKSYEVWLDEGSGFFLGNTISAFAPSGVLSATYPATTAALDATGFTLTLANQEDLDFLASVSAADLANGNTLLLTDDELMCCQTVTPNADGTFTFSNVLRGIHDTVPAAHSSGARVYFIGAGTDVTKPAPYGADGTITAKMLPMNSQGTFPITSATAVTLATQSRAVRPYPPGNVRMQGLGYGGTYAKVAQGGFLVTWSSRNRLTQTAAGTVVHQDAGDVTPEAGTTYTVKAYINGVLVRTVTGISAETFTYTGAMRVADGADSTKTVVLLVLSHANSLDSYQNQSQGPVLMNGFGMEFGKDFGGVTA